VDDEWACAPTIPPTITFIVNCEMVKQQAGRRLHAGTVGGQNERLAFIARRVGDHCCSPK